MRVVGYVRVSTDKQATEGRSLEVQRETIAAYAANNGLTLVGIFEDAGMSGHSLARPGLQCALDEVRTGSASAVVVTALDRLTRSARDAAKLLRGELRAEGSLLVIDDAIDDKAEVSSKRTRDALAHKKANGEFCGGEVPYGYTVDGGELVPCEEEQATIRAAKSLRAKGLSLREVGKELIAMGYVPRRAETYSPTMVKRMCQFA